MPVEEKTTGVPAGNPWLAQLTVPGAPSVKVMVAEGAIVTTFPARKDWTPDSV